MKLNAQEQIQQNNPDITFARLAFALASDYESIYVINTDDDSYTEYTVEHAGNGLNVRDRGKDFFADTAVNCRKMVYPPDQDSFLAYFHKDNLLDAIANNRSFAIRYRLMIDGIPRYHYLKIIRGFGKTEHYIIIGVQNIDEQMHRQQEIQQQAQTFSEIAESLASLYEVIYFIDPKTDQYSEYSSSEHFSRLGLECNGTDFFRVAIKLIKDIVEPEDYPALAAALDKDTLMQRLERDGVYSITYRQLLDNRQQYVSLIAMLQKIDNPHIVIAVRNIDEQKRREFESERRNAYYEETIRGLAKLYEVIYYVNVETNAYFEFCVSRKYAQLEASTTGTDFFGDTQRNMPDQVYQEDLERMSIAMEKSNFLKSLQETGSTTLNYRLMLDGTPQYVTLFAIRPKEQSTHVIIAVTNVDAAKRRELAFQDAIGSAMNMANRDALTGVKNKNAYLQIEREMDMLISSDNNPPFSIVVCDVNGLKKVNDTQGHKAGDAYIQSACSLICNIFKHSPVFRIGGDEFVILLKGSDFENRTELMKALSNCIMENKQNKLVTIASGISDFELESDASMQQVFERADAAMYINKKTFKHGLLG